MSPNTYARDQQADALTATILLTVRNNTRLNLAIRALLSALGLACATAALLYTTDHAAAIVAALDPAADGFAKRLFAQSWPILVLVILAILSGVGTWVAHQRGQEEIERASDGVARLLREAEVAIPARGLAHVFEEKLANVRRAYTLQLWLGRALFIVSIGLFVAAVVNQMASDDTLATTVYAAGSIVTILYATAKNVPTRIAQHLADVVQIQCAITACDRQFGVFETYAYGLLTHKCEDPETLKTLIALSDQIEKVVDNAITRIETYADPTAKHDDDQGGDVVKLAA